MYPKFTSRRFRTKQLIISVMKVETRQLDVGAVVRTTGLTSFPRKENRHRTLALLQIKFGERSIFWKK